MFFKDNQLYTESEIKALYPNTGFGLPFNPTSLGFEVVFETPRPEYGELEVAYQDGTEIDVKGNRVIKWSIRDMFSDYTDDEGVIHTKAEQEANYLYAKAKALVPNSITPRQARLILLQYGLLDDIEAMIATDRALGIWWEYSLEIKRDDEKLVGASNTLGLTDTQLDEMFIEGAKL